jgi:hypothetical protein
MTAAFSVIEATSGLADIVGPLLGAVTMTVHISIPFIIATVLFSVMYIPALLIRDTAVKVNSNPGAGDAGESEPLLHDADLAAPDEDAATQRTTSPTNMFRTKFGVFATGLGSIFLFYVAKGFINYLIPWVSLRFDETMARVRRFTLSS